ncbi:receptor-like protein 50 [Physcomitrium patens]|uniref:Leucine-rich repeat-containing N-terminal plant-type domain-containing protein n=1 Tax=Physcomitrium patens TaxID=3218 RepID=A9T3S2_PHYPA|nr:receptor-like protein 12 [Physcomitrium patens]XP_024372677.1 receptor-like protein 12 [Physcomitrium patens]PNR54744.1 hypothetical protein PHYPA_005637 [Physcomitrium patens]|eukprot:XP_024372676.1 receptor-like protein 12 [Physcomitrella patens]
MVGVAKKMRSDRNVARKVDLLVQIAVGLLLAISGCRAWNCSPTDTQILIDFKSGFIDRNMVFSTWDASTNCCTWSGVKCREGDGAILELEIKGTSAYNQQTYRDTSYQGGTVGAGLVNLTYLRKLKIQWVLLNGPIPLQWGEFSNNLVSITINNANLRDDIPSNLAGIQSLEKLDLKSNHLTGSIPSSFCNHKNIKHIDVSYNDMNYILVPTCLQAQDSVMVSYSNQGQSTSPGQPAVASALTITFSIVVSFGALSTALLFL